MVMPNPLFQTQETSGTPSGNPVIMDKQQLDLLRMLVQGYGQQTAGQWLINKLTPTPRPQVPFTPVAMGIRG
jgi:hypothetical protein